MVGILSASFGNGCTVRTSNLLSNKIGLYIHSSVGANTLPFHGGLLCVQAPLTRHAPRSTGGSTGCSGVLSEDFNAYIASGTDPALVAGTTVALQCLSRDPGDPFGDSLSDAVTATVCP